MSEYGNLEAGQDSDFFMTHMMAMTTEKLHSKGDIAAELAYRDQRIIKLEAELAALQREREQIRAYCWGKVGTGIDDHIAVAIFNTIEHSAALLPEVK